MVRMRIIHESKLDDFKNICFKVLRVEQKNNVMFVFYI